MENSLKYFKQLDGLRALAVIAVMLGHWMVWNTENIFIKNFPWHHGVILFFVLSGYLITQILLRQKLKISSNEIVNSSKSEIFSQIKLFYARRVFRIFPAYYVLILILLIINFPQVKNYLFWLISYSSNFVLIKEGNYIGEFSHLWSLAIEEQFYLFWPFVIFIVAKRNLLRTILFFLMISLISRIFCKILNSQDLVNWMWGTYFTLNLIFPLALGALIALFKFDDQYRAILERFSKLHYLYFSILVYSALYYLFVYKMQNSIYKDMFDEFVFSIVCFFIILRASNNGFSHLAKYFLEHDVLVFTGKISYGLYLYHMFSAEFYWKFLAPTFDISIGNKHIHYLVYFIITYLFALISFYLLENPLNLLKNKLFSGKTIK